MTTPRMYKDIPVPFFFREETADAFRVMAIRENDVFLSSLTKGGTTWVSKILYLLLHGINDEGQDAVAARVEAGGSWPIGSQGQVYPEALPLQRLQPPYPTEGAEAMRFKAFGPDGFEDLINQSEPRLFSTHLFGNFLPEQLLTQDGGKGRLVIVLRNLKDVMASLHFFRGEPKDGWLGNEFGPGSFHRFIADPCPNAYGSNFLWIKEMDKLFQQLRPSGRVIVLYYEALIRALPSEIDRLADFLGIRLTPAKKRVVINGVSFEAMLTGTGASKISQKVTLRKVRYYFD